MTKKEFIKSLADKQGTSQVAASAVLEDVKSIIQKELLAGNEVVLGSDFGTFKPTSRSGVIPGTTTKYNSKSVKFSVSAPFKRELN